MAKYDFTSHIEQMQKAFQVQNDRIINEQKKILEDYKIYIDGIMDRLEAQQQEVLDSVVEEEDTMTDEDPVKEIGEIRDLLAEAVETCNKEIPEIMSQLLALQGSNKTPMGTEN